MSADEDRCDHGLAGDCPFCRRGLPAEPAPTPEPVADDERLAELDEDAYSDDGLAWWQK